MIIIKLILFIILFIILFAIVTFLFLLFRFGSFFRMLFRGNGSKGSSSQRGEYNQGEYSKSAGPTISGQPKPRNSEFDKNEGEYVDFEEIS